MNEREKIVRYWHSIELLQPQAVPKEHMQRRANTEAYISSASIHDFTPPWFPGSELSRQSLPPRHEWSHTVYAYVYDSKEVSLVLKQKFGADLGYAEPQARDTAVFALQCDMSGRYVLDSLVLSSEAWFLGRIRTGQDYSDWPSTLQKEAESAAQRLLQAPVTADALRELSKEIIEKLELGPFFEELAPEPTFRFRSQPVRIRKLEREETPLNSFLLDDLSHVAEQLSQGVCSAPLAQYLKQHAPASHLDIDGSSSTACLKELLSPDRFSAGCWPSTKHHGLVHSQQLAVNAILSSATEEQPLMGVNGPPGTGKTTLLRDLIASIVVQRADSLASLDRASDAFTGDREQINDKSHKKFVYPLSDRLQGFEIVVASSNNGAVENITLELPMRNKIDACWLPDAEYFPEIGELFTGDPAWALISCPLGSKARRSAFIGKYFHGENHSKHGNPDDQAASPNEGARHAKDGAPLNRPPVPGEAHAPSPDTKPSHDENYRIMGLKSWLDEQASRTPSEPAQKRILWRQAVSRYESAKSEERRLRKDVCRIATLLPELESYIADLEMMASRIKALEAYPTSPRFPLIERTISWLRMSIHEKKKSHRRMLDEINSLNRTCNISPVIDRLRDRSHTQRESVEMSEPWPIQEWRKARANVFIQALKLHQEFFKLEPKRVRANLCHVNELLTGKTFHEVSDASTRSAWATLFMVVPVLSSTFASFSRSFGSLGASSIGWLLIDEAGQATPQAAVGALWRARRAVLVGDPLQLKPVLTVSGAAMEHMRTHYGVDAYWTPSNQSAQTLADQATRLGRMAGPEGSKEWVGLPLLVHRRCDKPMFALSNRIAYGGAMVYGTEAPPPAHETKARWKSGWFPVRGRATGNWVEEEGNVLEKLLLELEKDGVPESRISIITPFRVVRDHLRRLLKRVKKRGITYGTIHTMQGKEADIVILVLGGGTNGARDWAVSEPNLLNVAATRARRRLYVIGDREDWQRRSLFCEVMDLLPPLDIDAPASHSAGLHSVHEGDMAAPF